MYKEIESFDGCKIVYNIERRSKLFIVFLHGLGGELSVWKPNTNFLNKKGYSTVAIDLRGHGISSRPKHFSDYSLDKSARDVYAVLKKERIKRVVLVGHCFGGAVASEFYKLFNDRVSGYVFINSTDKATGVHKFVLNPFLRLVSRLIGSKSYKKVSREHRNFSQFIGTGDYSLRRLNSNIRHTSLRSWLYSLEQMSYFDGSETFKRFVKPTLIIAGARDSIFKATISKRFGSIVKTAELKIVPGANHVMPINNVTEINDLILSFVKKLK